MRRERLVGLRLGAYVASKVTVLVPFLLLVVVAMLGVLRLLDRLPRRPLSTYASMGVGLLLCAIAALGLGLLTSATVGNVAQATLALPMLCFPAVLFSGAILPVQPHGEGRRGPQPDDPIALGLRSHRSRSRGAADPRYRAARHSGLRCWRLTATRAPSPRAPTGSSSRRSRSCSWSPPGVCSCAAPSDRCAERRLPASRPRLFMASHGQRRQVWAGGPVDPEPPAKARPTYWLDPVTGPTKGSDPMNPNKALWEKGDAAHAVSPWTG